ncbi:MAG: hypothetical protein KKF62_16365 [Bacteroidetes bacterium]|nr:hypothetical protein [Bacteroidota bacterium]MBU1113680.1 hypothetical protein [Bacteroidota bacterium]MBU1799101.1 hypothetical protein [Bacteroidota bacterium]
MIKFLFCIILVIINSNIRAKDFILSAKYSTQINNDPLVNELTYWSYHAFSIEGLFSIWDDMIEIGPNFGFSYSEIPFASTVPEYSFSDEANILKNHFGGAIYFSPCKATYSPFIGVRGNILIDSIIDESKNKAIINPGLYNYKTSNDYSFAMLGGFKIRKNNFRVTFELEYQHRWLNLEYDEYGMSKKIHSSSLLMHIASLNFGVGLQYVF